MSGNRSPNQVLLNLQVSREFLEAINTAVVELKYNEKSSFIREAIIEKINRHRHPNNQLDASLALAPSRIGVGGKPTHKVYPTIKVVVGKKSANSEDISNVISSLEEASADKGVISPGLKPSHLIPLPNAEKSAPKVDTSRHPKVPQKPLKPVPK